MTTQLLRASRPAFVAGLLAAAVWFAAPAQATPLGLSVGDEVTSIEFDALRTVPGDGGTFDVSLGAIGGFFADGRINSVDIVGPATIAQSNVDLRFDLDLVSQNIAGGPTIFSSNAFFSGAAAVSPDFTITENNVVILTGNFTSLLRIEGNINIALNTPAPLSGVAKVTLTGGDSDLLNALGGAGGQANLLLTAGFFDFNASLASLASDGNVFNSNFMVSLTGSLQPLNPSPFVPEPATAVLLGGGLVGLLAFSRRVRRR